MLRLMTVAELLQQLSGWIAHKAVAGNLPLGFTGSHVLVPVNSSL